MTSRYWPRYVDCTSIYSRDACRSGRSAEPFQSRGSTKAGGGGQKNLRSQQVRLRRLALDHEVVDGVGRNYIAKIAQFEMAPHGRLRSVPKDRAVPIERLPEARFPKARPVDGAVLERAFRSGIPRLYRPGKHHEAVVGLNPGQTRLVKGMDALSHRTPLFE